MAKIKKNDGKKNMMLSGWLLLALAVSLMITGVSFAGFLSKIRDNAGAKVASFIVSAVGTDSTALQIDCTKSDALSTEYSFQVTNETGGRVSAAAAEYRIAVTLPQALPQGVAMTLCHEETGSIPAAVDGNVYSFEGAKALPPREKDVHPYALCFEVTDPALITEAVSLSGIRIEVIAEQIN